MDHISRISVFVEVAKQNSFSGAGRALGMTGPAISKQVQALESSLNVKLFVRTTRHVALTEEGSVFFEKARKALEDLSEAEQQIIELKECPTGRLKINAPMSFGNAYLAKPIAEFAKKYPDVEVEVDFNDRWVDVIEEGFDVVIRIGVLEDSSLVARKIANCPILLCASKELVDARGLPASIEDLENFPGIAYTKHRQTEEWHYEADGGEKGSLKIQKSFAANSAEMQLEACLQGLGIAVIPIFSAAAHLESGDLIQLLPSLKTYPERGIYALFPQNRFMATRVRLFVDSLTETGRAFPW